MSIHFDLGYYNNMAISQQAQEQANTYFQQLYNRELTVDDFVQQLKVFSNSADLLQQEILNCVIKYLFDEYNFLHEYPDHELTITAELYGGLIRETIVQNIDFAVAVRKVLESLKGGPYDRLWSFGLIALNAFSSCLFRYPKICEMLTHMDNYDAFPQQLKSYVDCGAQGLTPYSLPAQTAIEIMNRPLSMSFSTSGRFTPVNLTIGPSVVPSLPSTPALVRAIEIENSRGGDPPRILFDKVSFMCNNLSLSNFLAKAEEMKALIANNGEAFVRWLAHYVVIKRVAMEQNYQPLYNNFLLSIKNACLDSHVEYETFKNAMTLLRSDKEKATFADRLLLKNLGQWLGLITLARDKPILIKDLDLKLLLVRAFHNGQQELLFIVPFVSKTLTASKLSSIFRPTCAWVSGLISLLAEIHSEPDLKLNLKFEIEVLCKELNIDMRNIRIGDYLRQYNHLNENGLDNHLDNHGPMMAAISAVDQTLADEHLCENTAGIRLPDSEQCEPNSASFSTVYNYKDIDISSLEDFSSHLIYPPQSVLFKHFPQSKNLCAAAIVQAVKELMGGIADRAIYAALTTTEGLCRKDFAMDSEKQNLCRAAKQMMRAITAGLSYITCREPLSTTIPSYLKQAFYNHLGPVALANPTQVRMVEECAVSVTDANLELAVCFVVKNACEKGVIEVEKQLQSDNSSGQSANQESRIFQPDANCISMQKRLPESLRLNPNALGDNFVNIYNSFASKICGFNSPPERENSLMNLVRQRVAQDGNSESVVSSSTELQPTQSNEIETVIQSKVESILREWISICYSSMPQRNQSQELNRIIGHLRQNGIMGSEENACKFIETCTAICLDISNQILSKEEAPNESFLIIRQRSYYVLDAFVKLVCSIIKHCDAGQSSTKVDLVKKTLGIIETVLCAEYQSKLENFRGACFYRILIMMFNELTARNSFLQPAIWEVLQVFGKSLFMLQPKRVPPFTLHWLDIVGHRNFIGRVLAERTTEIEKRNATAMFTQLLLCHFKFIAPFLRDSSLPPSITLVYKGTLRLLLVLLHDFPEILCDYYYAFCDVIPQNCVQLRNLVLSAYPRNVRLPNPFTVPMDTIVDVAEIFTNMKADVSSYIPADLRTKIDNYLDTRSPRAFLNELPALLQNPEVSESKYNFSLVNALVAYMGMREITAMQNKQQKVTVETVGNTAFLDIFKCLVNEWCLEGRYLLFNALANQLRYSNVLTRYFACAILYLFHETSTDAIKELITRILFERLLALRPHPWGLLVTFIELIRNPRYSFWRHEFLRYAPEIEQLFSSVAKSCVTARPSSTENGSTEQKQRDESQNSNVSKEAKAFSDEIKSFIKRLSPEEEAQLKAIFQNMNSTKSELIDQYNGFISTLAQNLKEEGEDLFAKVDSFRQHQLAKLEEVELSESAQDALSNLKEIAEDNTLTLIQECEKAQAIIQRLSDEDRQSLQLGTKKNVDCSKVGRFPFHSQHQPSAAASVESGNSD
ncbi:CCR4-Not complex component, not1 domain-containing protein [Ditylenchus destructor]|uniref:CCR4-Not complex component, not1 domain-containing protein n=1 Tax=Ditylenchus destructor TaxID=166010 RepID=A0AAD4N159_9BILA|nr:CCR4-Not complex component, not1 domain-containing protein [Ditylenchus destructor]